MDGMHKHYKIELLLIDEIQNIVGEEMQELI
jgi:chromosomal replication initiation ATPase DnaA